MIPTLPKTDMKAQRNVRALAFVLVAAIVEFFLAYCMLVGLDSVLSPVQILAAHFVASMLGAAGIAVMASSLSGARPGSFFLLSLFVSLAVPFVGLVGIGAALILGIHFADERHREPVYWQVTRNAQLPFTTPIGRDSKKPDRRGFAEHLLYSEDEDDLHRKVLSAGNMRASLAVSTLKRALRHHDERIRLTAYKTLDKKVTELNREIQQLEKQTKTTQGADRSNAWLQIASNYWELLTLENDEPVARKQLLSKAAAASAMAVKVLPTNRNAYFTLGRAKLAQGDARRAVMAFHKAKQLGMPIEKVTPYLAEAAFICRDFKSASVLLKSIDKAFLRYPPLKNVAEYWA